MVSCSLNNVEYQNKIVVTDTKTPNFTISRPSSITLTHILALSRAINNGKVSSVCCIYPLIPNCILTIHPVCVSVYVCVS